MKRWAAISTDEQYRYLLGRRWSDKGPLMAWIMLNPSTADGKKDDPTIRQITSFSKRWGAAGLLVVNLFGFRTPDAEQLLFQDDPVGPENDRYIQKVADACSDIVVAWGARKHPRRVQQVMSILGHRYLMCLGTTRNGNPAHPLRLSQETPFGEWQYQGP